MILHTHSRAHTRRGDATLRRTACSQLLRTTCVLSLLTSIASTTTTTATTQLAITMPAINQLANVGFWSLYGLSTAASQSNAAPVTTPAPPPQSDRFLLPETFGTSAEVTMDKVLLDVSTTSPLSTTTARSRESVHSSGFARPTIGDLLTSTLFPMLGDVQPGNAVGDGGSYSLYELCSQRQQQQQQQQQAGGNMFNLSLGDSFLGSVDYAVELCSSALLQQANETSSADIVVQDQYLSPNIKIILIIFLTLMIVMTVVGNILVCLSVILVRKLRHPSNYLLVSLAISDLCVAILVMPLALQYELTNSWNLSAAICDLWVSFDVTCCTSSILNLCTISIDRYLAITEPLTYGVRRSTKKMLSFIAGVWILSCLISIPPVLLLGNEHGTLLEPKCEVSQNMGYQLYATLAAFYIPLVVMIVMYLKIYGAAKNVCDAEWKDQRYSATTYPSCSVGDEAGDGKEVATTAAATTSSRFQKKNKKCKGSVGGLNYHKGRPPAPPPPPVTTTTTMAQSNEKAYYHNHHHHHHHRGHSFHHQQQQQQPSKLDTGSHCEDNGHNNNNNNHNNNEDIESMQQQQKKNSSTHSSMRSEHLGNSSSSQENSSMGEPISCCRGRAADTNNNQVEKKNKKSKKKAKKNKTKKCDDHRIGLNVIEQSKRINGMPPQVEGAAAPRMSPSQSCSSCCCAHEDDVNVVTDARPPPNKQLLSPASEGSFKSVATGASGCSASCTNQHQHHHQQQQPHRRGIIQSFHRISRRHRKQVNNGSISAQMSLKRAQNVLRERKASITLGIIMTAFTVCWLPFFIMALIRPFTGQFFEIPRALHSTALWLGYANSMLNPIIYVTFHQDFRRAFKYLLCCQCSTMGSRLRAEAYLSQYGKSHHSSVSSATGAAAAAGNVGALYSAAGGGGRGTFPKLSGNRVTLDITHSAPAPLQQPLLGGEANTGAEEGKTGNGQKLNIPLDLNGNSSNNKAAGPPHSSSDSSSALSQNELDVLQQSLDAQLTPKVESRLHFGGLPDDDADKNELSVRETSADEVDTGEPMTTDYVLRGDQLESIQLSTAHPLVNVHTKLIYTNSNMNVDLPSHYEIIVPEGSCSRPPDHRETITEVILPPTTSTTTTTSVLPTNISTTTVAVGSTVSTTIPFPSASASSSAPSSSSSSSFQ